MGFFIVDFSLWFMTMWLTTDHLINHMDVVAPEVWALFGALGFASLILAYKAWMERPQGQGLPTMTLLILGGGTAFQTTSPLNLETHIIGMCTMAAFFIRIVYLFTEKNDSFKETLHWMNTMNLITLILLYSLPM